MKNTLVTLAFSFIAFINLNAQYSTEKQWNRFVLGGSVNFHFRQDVGATAVFPGQTSKGYAFKPYFGKVLSDRWLAGIQLNVGQTHIERHEIGQIHGRRVVERNLAAGIELFGRYTFNPSNKLQVYLRPYAGLTHFERKIDIYSINEKYNEINLGVDFGINYQISKRINLTARLGNLNFSGGKDEYGYYGESVDLNISPSNIRLGAEIKF